MSAQITWKKTAEGEWAILGPASVITRGATVEVKTRAGKVSQVTIGDVLTTDARDGIDMVIGFPVETKTTKAATTGWSKASQRRRGTSKRCATGGNCSSYNSGQSCGGHDCDGW